MILSTHTRGCLILNVHISIGFKYHEYYPKRCLTGNYMFSSEHEISDISKLHFHSCIWGRRGRDRMVVRFTATCAISAYHHERCEFETLSWRGVLVCDKVCQ